MSKNPMRSVIIEPALNGWIVRIGCATMVALFKEGMLSEIGRYIDDPKGVEKEYATNAVNQGTYQPNDGPTLSAEPPSEVPHEGRESPSVESIPEQPRDSS